MRSSAATSVAAAAAALALTSSFLSPNGVALAAPTQEAIFGRADAAYNAHRELARRSVTGDGRNLNDQEFDYVIIGGGLAGLTVASRLSEDADVTVAVIEAGPDAWGPDQDRYLVPGANLANSGVNTDVDWKWQTTSQAGLGGKSVTWPRGKVLGGSSAINGLYAVRASRAEHDSWGNLIGAPEIWGWDNMFKAMKRSERFAPPTQQVQRTVPSVGWNASNHGTDGPLGVSWPAVQYPFNEAFLQAMAATGTPISKDPDGGESWGAFLATSTINADNWQRSFSRNAYLDPAQARPNLSVLTGHQVTRILTEGADGSVKATGVQYAQNDGAATYTVRARREVIVSGGSINSPALLQLSGIGDPDQLGNLDIDVVVPLPGVGHNLQDHLSGSVIFSVNDGVQQPNTQALTGNRQQDSYVNSAIAYVSLSTLLGGYGQELIGNIRANLTSMVNRARVPDDVKKAYEATWTEQLAIFDDDSKVGPIEILFADIFNNFHIQVALQHPLSRGSIQIQSKNAFDAPAIDAGYLTHEWDRTLLREGFKLARRLGNTAPLSDYTNNELAPGTGSTNSDGQWDRFIQGNTGTEYHPSSSCGQLPREKGGVVDKNLLVYGTTNLRVIDASIVPIALSAHLMTATYGLAEIGADIVKAARAGQQYTGTPTAEQIAASSSSAAASGATSTGASGSNGSGGGSSSGNSNGANNSLSGGSFGAAQPVLLSCLFVAVASAAMTLA